MLPEVVTASPEFEGERVVPDRDQYPRIPDEAQVSPETQTVPVAFGNVQVLSAPVKSAEVIIPLNVAPVEVD